jgi:hypothetical protein
MKKNHYLRPQNRRLPAEHIRPESVRILQRETKISKAAYPEQALKSRAHSGYF